MKDAGRKLFFRYVRFKDGGGPRTDKILSKEDGFERRTVKISSKRTEADGALSSASRTTSDVGQEK